MAELLHWLTFNWWDHILIITVSIIERWIDTLFIPVRGGGIAYLLLFSLLASHKQPPLNGETSSHY